jgi:hypothetical protein
VPGRGHSHRPRPCRPLDDLGGWRGTAGTCASFLRSAALGRGCSHHRRGLYWCLSSRPSDRAAAGSVRGELPRDLARPWRALRDLNSRRSPSPSLCAPSRPEGTGALTACSGSQRRRSQRGAGREQDGGVLEWFDGGSAEVKVRGGDTSPARVARLRSGFTTAQLGDAIHKSLKNIQPLVFAQREHPADQRHVDFVFRRFRRRRWLFEAFHATHVSTRSARTLRPPRGCR